MDNEQDPTSEHLKSKSQIKREMIALQEIGERLASLSKEQLKKIDLPLTLREAIEETRRITSNSAKRRQMQYIGRLMRDVDDVEYIKTFLQQIEKKATRAVAYHHMLEAWRERLIEGDNSVLTEFFKAFASVDRQHLRQLVQNAKKESMTGKPVGAKKVLFRYLITVHQEKIQNK